MHSQDKQRKRNQQQKMKKINEVENQQTRSNLNYFTRGSSNLFISGPSASCHNRIFLSLPNVFLLV
jgi:hypothetical protein